MKFDVFFYEAFAEEQEALKVYLPGHIRAGFTRQTIQEYGKSLPAAGLISVRTQSLIPPAWASKLGAILSRSTGYDHLLAYRQKTSQSLPCGYLPLYCHRAVAEQALLMWLALQRKLAMQTRQFARFQRDGLTGAETRGRVLLVVGVGNIGYEIVKIGRGLDMKVYGVDLEHKHADVCYGSFESLSGQADIVVSAMNLTTTNKAYFNEKRLRMLKPGAIFINISRGELSPPPDLLRLLEENHLGGAGLDVYDNETQLSVALRETRVPDTPELQAVLRLAKRDNVILTPHNAFNTEEAVTRKSEQSIQQVTAWLEHGSFIWPVPSA